MKTKNKIILSFVLCLLTVLIMLPASVFAETTNPSPSNVKFQFRSLAQTEDERILLAELSWDDISKFVDGNSNFFEVWPELVPKDENVKYPFSWDGWKGQATITSGEITNKDGRSSMQVAIRILGAGDQQIEGSDESKTANGFKNDGDKAHVRFYVEDTNGQRSEVKNIWVDYSEENVNKKKTFRPEEEQGEEEITSVTLDHKSFVYNGEIQHANVTEVKAGDKVLSASEYTVKYSRESSKFAGKYTITVTGTGNYKGTKEAVYEIEPAPVTDATLSEVLYVYNREVQKPTLISVKSNNTVLTTNDYDAVYSNAKSKNKGEYSVTVTGRVNYTGTVEAIYHIDPAVVADATLDEAKFIYNQKIQKSKVKKVKSENGLVLTKDEYSVTYSKPKSTDVGNYKLTVSGKGNFTGKVEKSYKIYKAEITTVKLNKTEYTYNGKVQKSSVKSVKAGDLVLTKDDYSAKWSNKKSTDAGNYKITVTGKGNYTGSLDAYYRIKPAKISKVTVDKVKYTYNKKAQRPLVTKVKAGDFTLEKKDYSVNYSKKNSKDVGSYSLLVESKNPNFSGHEGTTYKINPLGTSITKLAAGSKSITATWKKQTTKMSQTTITGYQIQASLTKDFKSVASEAKVKGAAKTSGKLTGLKANKKYYVRIRTYKTIGKSTYFSGWKVYEKTVKVKK